MGHGWECRVVVVVVVFVFLAFQEGKLLLLLLVLLVLLLSTHLLDKHDADENKEERPGEEVSGFIRGSVQNVF